MTDHAWLDAAAPYALGALSAEERAAFEAHLADCAICRAEVQALREVSGLLAHAAAAATPAQALRDRILREARQVRPLTARRRSLRPWIAAAAVVLAIAAGVAYVKERGNRRALEQAVAAARDSLAAQQQLVAFDVTAVTEEPVGGSPQPTQQPFLVGKLSGGE